MLDSKDVGQAIRRCRDKLGMTRADLARKADINYRVLCLYEAGTSLPGFRNLEAMADALCANIDELIGREVPRG